MCLAGNARQVKTDVDVGKKVENLELKEEGDLDLLPGCWLLAVRNQYLTLSGSNEVR